MSLSEPAKSLSECMSFSVSGRSAMQCILSPFAYAIAHTLHLLKHILPLHICEKYILVLALFNNSESCTILYPRQQYPNNAHHIRHLILLMIHYTFDACGTKLSRLFTGTMPLKRVKYSSKQETDAINNFKILQSAFKKLNVDQVKNTYFDHPLACCLCI